MNESEPVTEPKTELPADSEAQQDEYIAQARYPLLAALALIAAFGLLWQTLSSGLSAINFFFVAVALIGGLWSLWMATTRVQVTDTALLLKRPIGKRQIDFPQLVSVTAQGRFFNSLTVIYYPRRSDGLIDTDRVASVLAPAVANQAELIERLETKITP